MFNSSEVFIYFWLVPLTLWLISPLFLSILSFTAKAILGVFPGQQPVQSREAVLAAKRKTVQDKRRTPRVAVFNTLAHVSDGVETCTGLACNISKAGIGLMHLSENLNKESEKFSVVIKSREKKYHMDIKPKWYDMKDSGKGIGAEIVSIPSGWKEFVDMLEKSAVVA